MDAVFIVGTVAALCTTVSFFPQVIKIYRTRHTRDLSLPMYIIFSLGVFLWMCYGFLVHSVPIIVANAVIFVLTVYIMAMKLKYK